MKKVKFYGMIGMLSLIGLTLMYFLVMSISIIKNDIADKNSDFKLGLSYIIALTIFVFLFIILLSKTNSYKNKFL